MNILISRNTSRFLTLWLAVLMIACLFHVPSAQAIRYLSDGSGDSSEGDPLDANDFSDGGGGLLDDNIQDNYSVIISGDGGFVINLPVSDRQVLLLVDFRTSIPFVRVIKISPAVSLTEDPDAR